jgi:transcriptional regulator
MADKGDAMYVPKAFDASDRARCHALMRAESFAILVTTDEAGLPFATHLPVLLDGDRGPLGTLLAHVARPNPQWRHFGPGRRALVVFHGPHAYVSPSWYATHPSVPTWNYVAVHAYGVPCLIEEAAAVKALLGRLVRTYEAGRPEPWRVESLPADYVDRMIQGIVAFEIPIDRLEGKAKLSQNRSPEDQARVAAGLRADGDGLSRAVADLMAP